jgi:hypothetical protein
MITKSHNVVRLTPKFPFRRAAPVTMMANVMMRSVVAAHPAIVELFASPLGLNVVPQSG